MSMPLYLGDFLGEQKEAKWLNSVLMLLLSSFKLINF